MRSRSAALDSRSRCRWSDDSVTEPSAFNSDLHVFGGPGERSRRSCRCCCWFSQQKARAHFIFSGEIEMAGRRALVTPDHAERDLADATDEHANGQ